MEKQIKSESFCATSASLFQWVTPPHGQWDSEVSAQTCTNTYYQKHKQLSCNSNISLAQLANLQLTE